MATILVSDLPDDVYHRIAVRAAARNESVASEAARLLEQAVQRELPSREQHAIALDQIIKRRFQAPRGASVADSADLLREDRQR